MAPVDVISSISSFPALEQERSAKMSELHILIVDDEAAIRDMIRVALELAGFHCSEADSAATALPMIIDSQPDLVLLDWMMPETSGLELLRRLKRDEATAEIPVILLTAKVEEQNVVSGLDAGADDYVTKPFRPRELLSRIKAVIRRTEGPGTADAYQVGGLRLDPAEHRVYVHEEVVNMGPTEFKLLEFFMSHPERAYSRGQLLDRVWGSNVYVEERTVDVHIRRLRKALQTTLAEGQQDCSTFVQTVRGTGYRFSAK